MECVNIEYTDGMPICNLEGIQDRFQAVMKALGGNRVL